MTEAQWKLVMDQRGVTITNDRFEFRTTGATQAQPVGDDLAMDDAALEAALEGAESSQMEAIISELQTMTRRTYGQFCGLSRALEVVGERWSMLIIRDLLVGPRSLNDLQRGLPRIPTDLLCTRLKELEHTGIVSRRVLTDPDSQGKVVYELTDYGRELDEITLALGLWGARMLGDPRPEDIVTAASLIMAMRATFQPEAAKGIKADYEIHFRDIVFHCRINDGKITAGEGTLPAPDLVMEPGRMLKPLMAGELDPYEVIHHRSFPFTGDPDLLVQFAKVFHIPQNATDHD
jgi:DNA-binding HxlR family transcriptional regulator